MLLLNHLYLLIIIHELVKVALIVVNYLNFIGPFVLRIDIPFKLSLQVFIVVTLVPKIFNWDGVLWGVNNLQISFELLNGCIVEAAPVDVEDNHDYDSDYVWNGDHHIIAPASVIKVTKSKASYSRGKGLTLSVLR